MRNFFLLYKFSLCFCILYFLTSIIDLTSLISSLSSDDGSLEPKRYSVDFSSQ